MWYVIWTSTGMEEKTASKVRQMACQTRCFVPKRRVQVRRQGTWEFTEKTIFPGYLFVDTDDVESLAAEVAKLEGFHTLLKEEKKYIPLSEREAELTESLCQNDGVVDFSQGIIEGDTIIVTSGPLRGQEGFIRKIDRHKRIAYLEIHMFNQVVKGAIGLEIIEKNT